MAEKRRAEDAALAAWELARAGSDKARERRDEAARKAEEAVQAAVRSEAEALLRLTDLAGGPVPLADLLGVAAPSIRTAVTTARGLVDAPAPKKPAAKSAASPPAEPTEAAGEQTAGGQAAQDGEPGAAAA